MIAPSPSPSASSMSSSTPSQSLDSIYPLGQRLFRFIHRPTFLRTFSIISVVLHIIETIALIIWCALVPVIIPLLAYRQFLVIRACVMIVVDGQAAWNPLLLINREVEIKKVDLSSLENGELPAENSEDQQQAAVKNLRRKQKIIRSIFIISNWIFTIGMIIYAAINPDYFLTLVPILCLELTMIILPCGLWLVLLLLWPAKKLSFFAPFIPISQKSVDSFSKEWRTKQATVKAIKTIPEIEFRVWSQNENKQFSSDQSQCAICCSDFELDNKCRALKCGHLYHRDCIDKWLNKKAVCPLCLSSPIQLQQN